VDANFLTDLATRTQELREQGLYKNERILVSPPERGDPRRGRARGPQLLRQQLPRLCRPPAGRRVARAALERYGFGMASVRFICGTQDLHKTLEARLSRFFGTEDTILYSSCFDANGGLFETCSARRTRSSPTR
jgi:glycine C-acetyltransferase